MHTFYKKKFPKLNYIHLKPFFWWLSSNFAIYSCKMNVTFDSSQDIHTIFRQLKKKKNSIEKKVKNHFFGIVLLLFWPKIVYNSCFSNQLFVQIIFPCTLWEGLWVPQVSKLQHQNSNYNYLLELQKLTFGYLGIERVFEKCYIS